MNSTRVVSVPSQRDAARLLAYRLTGLIVTPVVCAYARESVAPMVVGVTSIPREGSQ